MAAPYCPDALTHLKRCAKAYHAAVADAVARGVALTAAQRSQLDTVRQESMPGVREAIEQPHWHETLQYVSISAWAIESYCDRLHAASALLRD